MIDIFEVLGWLNHFDRSHLSHNATLLVRSARVVDRSDESVERIVVKLQDIGEKSADPLELAEIFLHCAALGIWRGMFTQASRHAKKAVVFYKNDDHRRAIARWMLGIAQWETLQNHKAYINWDTARRLFNKRREFFGHSPAERSWYENRLREMDIDLAMKPEEIITWLNCFENLNLMISSRRLVEITQKKILQRKYPTVYTLLQDLQEINKWSTDVYERAEVFLECGFAAYQMGNLSYAIELLKKAVIYFSPGIGNNHKQMVARWMLGAVESMTELEQNQAIVDWRECIGYLGELGSRADIENKKTLKKWYKDRRVILSALLLGGDVTTDAPPPKPKNSKKRK